MLEPEVRAGVAAAKRPRPAPSRRPTMLAVALSAGIAMGLTATSPGPLAAQSPPRGVLVRSGDLGPDGALRVDRGELRRGLDGRRRNVLELERDYVDGARELAHPVKVFVIGGDLEIGDVAGRSVTDGRIGMDPVSELARLDCEHPPELAGSEHTDG